MSATDDRAVDLTWVDRLLAVGHSLGGVDLPQPTDTPAGAAAFNRW